MACGLPIICSNVCDNSIYVKEGFNGFLFNPNDINSICDALKKMLSLSDVEYLDFCHRSREQAVQKFSKERFIQSYIKLIET